MKGFFDAALLGAAVCAGLVLAPNAGADEFTICPSGVTGVATDDTSCAFAENVRAAWNAQPGAVVRAYSPVSEQSITMGCVPAITDSWPEAMRCTGSNSSGVGVTVFFARSDGGSESGSQSGTLPEQFVDSDPSVAADADSPNLPYFDTPNVGCTWVNGYTKSNGTQVSGHFRC